VQHELPTPSARPRPRAAYDERISADAVAALVARPRFPEAVRSTATTFVELYQGNRLLNTLLNDRGRMVIGYLSLYLHYSYRPDDPLSGLTVSRVKEFCAEQKLCSAGRAEAILMVMRLFGYLEQAPGSSDRRVRRLVPTDRLVGQLRERWQRLFAAMAMVMPEGEQGLSALDRPNFAAAFVARLADYFRAGVRLVDHSPGLDTFADRNAGIIILMNLMLAGDENDTFPPTRPVPVSISALSKRFGVSRVHVRKVLRDVAALGWTTPTNTDDGRVILQEPLRQAMLNFFATAFLLLGAAIRDAREEISGTADVNGSAAR
jgi:hypothetical protein